MKFLRAALLLNASSCIVFGVIFVLFDGSVSLYIGNSFSWLMPMVGAALLLNGVHLVVASQRAMPLCPEILYFVAGDFLWVVATVVLLGLGLVITSPHGVLVSLLIAAMVGSFGVMQVVAFRHVCARKTA